MKIDNVTGNAILDLPDSKKFSVTANSAKLFSLLSTVLYSNKELAVIYENCANAVDIHVQTGQADRPIEITVPTMHSMFVRIRDYGTGLSEADVYRLLTTYGESTKNNSNDQIGGWGIGFKSTAAVTNSWSVISHFAGESKEYLIYIDGTGIPSITCIRTESTDTTGIEVVIPIQPSKMSEWRTALSEAFTHYKVKPKFVNDPKFMVSEYKTHRSTDLYDIAEGSSYYGISPKVLISNRAYKIDKDLYKHDLTSNLMISLLGMPINIKANIGDVDMSLSREGLQFTRRTIDFLNKKLREVYDSIISEITTDLTAAKDAIDFRHRIHLLQEKTLKGIDSRGFIQCVLDSGAKFPRYGVKNIRYDVDRLPCLLKATAPAALKLRAVKDGKLKSVIPGFDSWKTRVIKASTNLTDGKEGVVVSFDVQSTLNNRVTLVVADVKDVAARVKLKSANQLGIYLISDNFEDFPKELEKYIIKASSLPLAARAPRKPREKIEDYAFVKYRNSWSKVTTEHIDDSAAFVYITDARKGDAYSETNNFTQMDQLLSLMTVSGRRIYGVKEGKPVPAKLKGLHVLDVARKQLQKYHESDILKKYEDHSYVSAFSDQYHWKNLLTASIKAPEGSLWATIQNKYVEATKMNWYSIRTQCEAYAALSQLVDGIEISLEPQKTNDLDVLRKTYPMMCYVSSSSTSSKNFIQTIEDYIKSIGK